ncbi:uncharacterized protein LOC131025685 [Salvia miltiorrhiza]|uniref:uncharacterized protein LOC131025685 n=1 Tax=Salvia miltiorrhiza TaxID=226208 RepID=UPI0025AD7E84|nr:uncharacterized protein LOC131025685 [Salvia miltiorrhiza]
MSDEQSSGDEQMLRDELFKLTMRQEWEVVVKKYVENTNAHTLKLTKSEDTAFHIAISSYNPKCPNPNLTHQRCTEEMFSLMKERKSLCNVVKMANVRGDTPLHLAAAVGWEALCTRIASADPKLNANGETPLSDDPKLNANGETPLSDDPMLIQIRNANGETPLFIAAHHGNLNTFLALHDIYKPDETLCRRKDGNTILHSAISGEYLRLAYSILDKYKNLLNSVNVEGETPLHVLARKPNLFKSSSQLGFYESVIYEFVFVDDLKKQSKHNPSASQSNGSSKEKFPESYKTCVSIFHLLWDPIYNSYKGKKSTQQPYEEHGVPIYESFLAGCSRSKKQIAPPTVENVEHQIKVEKRKSNFPPNYTTCIKIFKFATTVALTILGIGFLRIRKIHDKKVRHSHAMEIMNRMIESEPNSMRMYPTDVK